MDYRHTLLSSAVTAMALNVALELSVEQLVSALNKKIFMECTRVQSRAAPVSRTLVEALMAEVRLGELKGIGEF